METLLIGKKEIFPCCLVRIQRKVMLYVSSFLLLLVNAVTFRRVIKFFCWVAYFTLVYSGALWFDKLNIILLSTVIAMYEGLFHSISITHSFPRISMYNRSYSVIINLFITPDVHKINGSYGKENLFLLVNQIYRQLFWYISK